RCDRRSQPSSRQGAGHGPGWRQGARTRAGAAGGARELRHVAALTDARACVPQAEAAWVRGSTAARCAEDHRAGEEGEGRSTRLTHRVTEWKREARRTDALCLSYYSVTL